jgi:hypothetical protein
MLLLLAWCAASAAGAVIAGRAIKLADRRRPTYTPQLDSPLWRGTDLPDPDPEEPPCPPSR